jgi:hypothetical protein
LVRGWGGQPGIKRSTGNRLSRPSVISGLPRRGRRSGYNCPRQSRLWDRAPLRRSAVAPSSCSVKWDRSPQCRRSGGGCHEIDAEPGQVEKGVASTFRSASQALQPAADTWRSCRERPKSFLKCCFECSARDQEVYRPSAGVPFRQRRFQNPG